MRHVGNDSTFYVPEQPLLSDSHISRARVGAGPEGFVLELMLTQEGFDRLLAATEVHQGERLAVVIGSRMLGAFPSRGSFPPQNHPMLFGIEVAPGPAEDAMEVVRKRWPVRQGAASTYACLTTIPRVAETRGTYVRPAAQTVVHGPDTGRFG